MTNNEIKKTLKDASQLVNMMDKSHINRLLNILIGAQTKKGCAFFLHADVRKLVKKLLVDLMRSDHVNNRIDRKKMKQIYIILGDYHLYPKCKLCGQPIQIDSYIQKHMDQSNQLAFSWDHRKPKSLGGSYDLANMEPTHKICNNKRDTKPAYGQKRKRSMKINIELTFDLDKLCNSVNPRYRPSRFGLRKQDSWCHKQYCQCCR